MSNIVIVNGVDLTKLLELYKELATVRGDMLYCYEVVDFIAYNSMEKKETQLENEIKEIENDK